MKSVMTNLHEQVRKTLIFLAKRVGEYYEEADIWLPSDFTFREFAYQPWTSSSYVRHISFNSHSDVREFLVKHKPRHFYYSSARYDQPGVPDMDAKGWRSSDITFDIDADHLGSCKDRVVTIKTVHGKEVSLVDESCIRLAALEAHVLVNVLVEELGFDKGSIMIEFSGNRGFHVTVYLGDDDERARLGQEYRRELINYIKGIDLQEETIKPWITLSSRRKFVQAVPPTIYMAGMRGRIARIARQLALLEGDNQIATIFSERDLTRATLLYHNSRERADSFIEKALELARLEVDEQVTIDLKRLIRVPGSINGKTGLVVARLSSEKLVDFTLNEELSPFKSYGAIRVRMLADLPSSITILGHRLKLHKDEKPRLPASIAFYLMSKELAVLAQ